MENRFRTQLTNMRAQFISDNDIKDTNTGNWEPKPHFHFVSLYKQYVHKGKRENFMERAMAEMPLLTRVQIEVNSPVLNIAAILTSYRSI